MVTSRTLRIGLWIGLILAVGWARADETTELRQQLQDQYKAITEMQAKLVQLEQGQAAQEQKMATMKPGEMTIPETLKWVEKIKLYGDFRYRHATLDEENSGDWKDGRSKHQIRARLGMTALVNDEFTFDMRLATGNDNSPTSGNFGFGDTEKDDDSFSDMEVWLDRAYLTYKPKAVEGLSVLAGKMGTPFYQVGKNELIWDNDLNPEGGAVQYNLKFNEQTSMFVNAAGFWVTEDDTTADVSLWGGQAGLTHKFDETNTLTGGAGYFDYGNIEGYPYLYHSSSKGNTVNADDEYVYDYNLVELFGEYGTKIGSLPLAFYGDYIVNTVDVENEDAGWLVGTTLNKCKDPGSWEFGYDYRDLDKDCTLGAFNDSDFVTGGTNAKGHRFSLYYQLAKNVQTGITYRMGEKKNAAEDKVNLLQLDVVLKF